MDNAVKLLVVEDNPADSDLIREYLSEITEFESSLHCVSTLGEAKGYLADNAVHAVLVDLSLPDSRGLETLREIVNLLKSATAIVLTSLDDKALALDAIESGAQDYLLKGSLGPEALARVIRYSLQRNKWLTKISEVQEQFYQSQKMESIGRMAGGIAHDFNNQLGAIGLLCDLSRTCFPKGHGAHTHLAQIQVVVERAATLTKRLMVFCRKHPFEMKVVDVAELIQSNRMLISKLLGESIRLEIKCEPGMTVLGDAGLLEQALMNMAINARDAMENGGILSFEVLTKDGASAAEKKVFIRISDTGSGMSAETLNRIFEPFFTTKAVGRGTGLGLSMVYGTIKQAGGDIAVESKLGVGTVFTITLPYSASDKLIIEVPEPNVLTGQETILVAEDEEVLRNLIVQVLSANGYEVLIASNGVEALKLIVEANLRVDLLISDMVMPGMSGVELSLKARALNPNIKIIFSSGYSGDGSEGREIIEDANFLPKPSSSHQLLLKVREVLDGDAPL